jgi:hypothetical protein
MLLPGEILDFVTRSVSEEESVIADQITDCYRRERIAKIAEIGDLTLINYSGSITPVVANGKESLSR